MNKQNFEGWITGFLEGEGSFDVNLSKKKAKSGVVYMGCYAKFMIGLRQDDYRALEFIQKKLKCGKIIKYIEFSNHFGKQPMCRYTITIVKDLKEKLMPIIDRVGMYSKKRKDYKIWKKGVNYIYKVQKKYGWKSWIKGKRFFKKFTEKDYEYIGELAKQLREVRKYKDD